MLFQIRGGTEYCIDLSKATTDVQQIIMLFVRYGGQLGNDIFIVSSAWFLLGSTRVNVRKAVHIAADCWVISVLFMLGFTLCGVKLPLSVMLKSLIPITMNANWFVGCYLIYYLIHPALNITIEAMDQKQLLTTNLVLAFFYCGIQTIIRDRYYYTQVVGFICIYFFTAYMKKYMDSFVQSKKKNIKLFLLSAGIFICSLVSLNFLGLRIGALRNYMTTWSVITNPFLIVMAMALFNLFHGITFYSKSVNYISGLSLLIYMIHGNRLVEDELRMRLFAAVYQKFSYNAIVCWCFVLGIGLLAGSAVLSILYKEGIQKPIYRLSDSALMGTMDIGDRMIDRVIRKE